MKYKDMGLYHNKIDKNWTPIFYVNRSFTYIKQAISESSVSFATICRTFCKYLAKESTITSIVIDLLQRNIRKIPHLHNVALSRVKSIEKLQILSLNEKVLHADDVVKTEMHG